MNLAPDFFRWVRRYVQVKVHNRRRLFKIRGFFARRFPFSLFCSEETIWRRGPPYLFGHFRKNDAARRFASQSKVAINIANF